ncbi:hypothetical protein [Nonomuraea rubra]|uniref:Uncharacterized protein n=1 Tax=Nonomuraea rubra TaxID=46180 RepID=A0A7X0TVP5_9ACTN|nr:hypothetical protein [Nonomuraea rubra]MBB6545369.1 hypothetical protein [Nonomuraea rubra]
MPSKARAGSRTVTVRVGGKTATASFTVVAPQKQERHDRRR